MRLTTAPRPRSGGSPMTSLLASLDATHVLAQRLATVQLGLVRELDGRGLAVAQGASSTAVWLRERLRLSGRSARQLVQLAATVDAAPPAVRDALLSGAITVEQGRVVAETIAALPVEAGPEVADKATQLLVAWADRFDPTILSRLGERVLTHVAPELADQAELKALDGPPSGPRPAGTSRSPSSRTGRYASAETSTPKPRACYARPSIRSAPRPVSTMTAVLVSAAPTRWARSAGWRYAPASCPTTAATGLSCGDRVARRAGQRRTRRHWRPDASHARRGPPPRLRRWRAAGRAGRQQPGPGRRPPAPALHRPADGARWCCGTAVAPSLAVTGRRDGATVTTSDTGPTVERRRWAMRCCSAATTTGSSTAATGRSASRRTADPTSCRPAGSTRCAPHVATSTTGAADAGRPRPRRPSRRPAGQRRPCRPALVPADQATPPGTAAATRDRTGPATAPP